MPLLQVVPLCVLERVDSALLEAVAPSKGCRLGHPPSKLPQEPRVVLEQEADVADPSDARNPSADSRGRGGSVHGFFTMSRIQCFAVVASPPTGSQPESLAIVDSAPFGTPTSPSGLPSVE